MFKRGLKKHLFSGIFTVLVIGLLVLSTPATAVNVVLNMQDINAETDLTKTFTIEIDINDGEFLPLLFTEVDFDNNAGDVRTCIIDKTNTVSGCDFLTVVSKDLLGLLSGLGFGYGYGVGGFGYGYGYGYGTDAGFDTGKITYTLEVDVSKIPKTFLNKLITVEARVYGGDSALIDVATFSGSNTFSVIGLTDDVAVNKSLSEFNFAMIQGANTAENQIKTTLNLVRLTADNVAVNWESSNTNVINPYSGEVTRPGYTDTDKAVTLTATLSRGDITATKSFSLTVLKELKSDTQSVDDALADLDIGDLLGSNPISTSVTTDLTLPTIGLDGTSISWSSSNANLIDTAGSVMRPNFDTPITLTATVSKGAVSKTEQFTFVVIGTVDLNEVAVNNAKLALTEALLLNGNPSRESVLGDLVLVSSLTGHPGVAVGWVSSNVNITALNGTVFRGSVEDKQVTLTATLSKSGKSVTKSFVLTVKKKVPPAVAVANKVAVNVGEEEVVVDNTNIASVAEIEIPATVNQKESVTLNVKSLVNEATKELQLASNASLTFTRKSATAGSDIKVEIPQGTKIKGESNWNGLIIAPTVQETTQVNVTIGTPEAVIEVGLKSGKLTFDKATRILVPGQAGKRAGFVRDKVFTPIQECTAAQIADPNTLVAEGDCFTTSGSDLIIWTKHFTQFVAFTPNPEVCDGIDNDGDLLVDEGVKTTYYRNNDGDGYGDINFPTQACSTPSGYVSNSNDCNDGSNSVKPGATEVCNSVDDNCDGQTDEGGVCAVSGVEICNNIDDDNDGQTDEGLTRSITCGAGICTASATQTCNNGNWVGACTSGNPQTEVADGLDNNCNGQADEGFLKTFYYDADDDNYGQSHLTIQSAFPSGQYSAVNYGDCRPQDKSSFPGAQEMCDGADNNCNGIADQEENLKQSCYDVEDKKYAGIGACSYGYYACLGSYFSDTCVGAVAPIAEKCDGIDNDCDGQVDEDFDADADGYTTCGTTTDGEDGKADSVGLDCNDELRTTNPGQQELCDGIDNDCSGTRDDNLAFKPADNQNGICYGVEKICRGTNGWEEPNYSSVEGYESSESTCDGKDNNCNGQVDEGFPNFDSDRHADCVDSDVDNDGLVDNRDAIVGTPSDSTTNAAYKLVIAGQEFTGNAVRQPQEGRKQVVLKEEDGRSIAWFSYLFDPTNLLDFRNVVLDLISKPVDETGRGSSLLISGVPSDGVWKSYLLKKLDTSSNMICIKKSPISSISEMSNGCTMPDELLIPCNGKNIQGFRCTATVKEGVDVYRIDGINYYAVSEVNVEPSDFSRDNKVDFDDFFVFADHFETNATSANWNRMFDLTYDNKVDFDDFLVFADNFGKGTTTTLSKKQVSESLMSFLGVPEEVCDGTDNDNDGKIDEDLTRLIGTDEDVCDYGVEQCINGVWRESIESIGVVDSDNNCLGLEASSDSGSSSSNSGSSSGKTATSSTCGQITCSWTELNADGDGCGELSCNNECGEKWVEQTLSCEAQEAIAPEPVSCDLIGDFNGDDDVDEDDFLEFADAFDTDYENYDLDNSGKVDFDDFLLFSDDFGKTC